VNPALLGTVVLGGIAVLDATPVAQTLLSQPLVTATLLGWLWNDWPLALQVGIVLQILSASTLPIGARTPEDYAAGGVIGTGLALVLASQQAFDYARDGCALVGVLAGLVAAVVGVPLVKWQRRRNEGLGRWAEAALRDGNGRALGIAHGAGVALAFGVGIAFTALAIGAGAWGLGDLVSRESLRLSHAWALARPLWIGLGLAQLLNAFIQRRLLRAALFGGALLATWLALLVGMP
jgi:mannose/fructose/N-acetylgalactosamine-specific phosphotransferase system component IIC